MCIENMEIHLCISIVLKKYQGCPQVISFTGTHKKNIWVASRDAQKKNLYDVK